MNTRVNPANCKGVVSRGIDPTVKSASEWESPVNPGVAFSYRNAVIRELHHHRAPQTFKQKR